MRNLLTLVVVALASAMSLAGAATAQVPYEDSVSGAASTPFGFFVEIDAHSGPSGENASGTLAITEPVFSETSEFEIVCLRVTGNTAVFGANSQSPDPRSGLFRVVDGSPDTLEADHLDLPAGPDDCAKPFTPDEGPTVPSSGDFVVTDAPARRMVGKGAINGIPGGTASYAYIVGCYAPANTGAPFEVRFGSQRFRLSDTAAIECSDDPTVSSPVGSFDTQVGTGSGTLTSGGPGTMTWRFVDGGSGGAKDAARIQIVNSAGTIIFQGVGAPPGKFPGSTQANGYNTAQRLP